MPNPKGNPSTLKPYQAKWNSGATQVIRVPMILADQIQAYARLLDSGKSDQSLLQVIEKLNSVLETPRNNFSAGKKRLLQSAIADLESLVTVKEGT